MLDVPLSITDLHNIETQVQRSFNGKYINNLKWQVFDRCSFEDSKGFGVSQVWVSEGFCDYKEGQASFIKRPLHNEVWFSVEFQKTDYFLHEWRSGNIIWLISGHFKKKFEIRRDRVHSKNCSL